ncbi:MAG: cytidylate kinase-like family protein [Synergistaceae bacterium]|jgi:cytidylate kinase|nr:cytidylate kinase-like family protein [Synergistaceae bacterium]
MGGQVIAISREFGSGGRQVGERLAEELGVAFYDKALIHLAVAKSGFDPITFEKAEEEAASKFLFNLAIGSCVSAGGFPHISVPISDQVFFAQAKVIEELGARGNCVIIGRCSTYLLRNRCLRVFIHGEAKDRLRRIVEEYGVTEAEARMAKIDRARANYHQHYTDEVWGAARSYDLAINTSYTGVDGAIRVIRALR